MRDPPRQAKPDPDPNAAAPQPPAMTAGADPQVSTDSRWSHALGRLREDKPNIYEAFGNLQSQLPIDPEKLAGGMFDVIEKKRIRLESRQWTLPFQVSGRSIPIRKHLDTVFKCLRAVKDIGSAAASLDPVYAGIP
jgi:hypothetical protein